MKNRHFLMMMMALCLMGFAGCSDSDDGGNGGGENAAEVHGKLTAEQALQREAVASVLNMLTGQTFCDTTDVNFEGRTFEAAIGEVRNESRPSERSIRVRTAALAEGYFRSLAGGASAFVKETADGYVIDLTNLDCHSTGRKQSLGTLTFHRGSGADNVGYADIDIACIPGLQRISYKTAEQWGDNGNFVSPISWGEIFIGEGGRYWICVREATGSHPSLGGVLINMQSGRGDKWGYIYKYEKWAAWEPEDNQMPSGFETSVLEYVELCGDPSFATQKRRIMAQSFGTKVFPDAWSWNWNGSDAWELWQLGDPGFGTLDKGYCHRAYYSPGMHGVIIVMEATEGHYQGIPPYNWRRWAVWCTEVGTSNKTGEPVMASHTLDLTDASALHRYDFMYTYYRDFYQFPYFSVIYTVRAKTFNGSIPIGFTKVDI